VIGGAETLAQGRRRATVWSSSGWPIILIGGGFLFGFVIGSKGCVESGGADGKRATRGGASVSSIPPSFLPLAWPTSSPTGSRRSKRFIVSGSIRSLLALGTRTKTRGPRSRRAAAG
jgi:hypothetical protein